MGFARWFVISIPRVTTLVCLLSIQKFKRQGYAHCIPKLPL